MQFRIFGPLEVVVRDRLLELGRPGQWAALAILVLNADRVVAVDRLIEQLWDGQPPPQATASLQACIYDLRRLLEPGRTARTPPRVLQSQPPGYRLVIAGEAVDAARFQTLAVEGHRLLEAGEHRRAADVLAQGSGLWRGPVLADLGEERFVQGERDRLEESRLTALEDRITAAADLELGHYTEVATELEALVAHPFRERLHGLRMIGLYRNGRQADALHAHRRTVSRLLREELGVDPSPWLQQLRTAVLRQAPALVRARTCGTGTRHVPDPALTGRASRRSMRSRSTTGDPARPGRPVEARRGGVVPSISLDRRSGTRLPLREEGSSMRTRAGGAGLRTRRRPAVPPVGPMALRAVAVRSLAIGAAATGAAAIGALAVGAAAIGSLAVGRLVIGRAEVRDLRLSRLEVDELVITRQNGPLADVPSGAGRS